MLHDVDKNNDDRSSPAVNAHDKGPDVRMAHGTNSFDPKTDATTAEGYLQSKNGRLLGNDGSNNVGLFGFDDTGHMVVKVAKPGFDANSATDDQLIFNSSQDVFKIVLTGTTTLTPANPFPSATTITATVIHNLGYAPTPVVTATIPDYIGEGYFGSNRITNIPASILAKNGVGSVIILYAQARTDATNLYIDLLQPNGVDITGLDAQWSFKYYLLRETAN